jgi:ABC-2 type transport system ATP-binding protein
MTASSPRVRITALTKTYRGGTHPALSSVDLEIPEASCFGLLGPNGAGKTTLVSILCGIRRADSGSIQVRNAAGRWFECGARTGGARTSGVAELIGLVPQELAFYPTLTVLENLHYFGMLHGLRGSKLRARTDASLAIARLETHAGQRAEALSGGLQRRLNLAIGVIHAPPLLVLDEPTVGVDSQSRRFVLEELARLKRGGTTILYTSHYLDEVEQLCDRLAVIDLGRVVAQGSREDLLRESVVTLRTAARPPAALLEQLAAIPSVSALHHDETALTLASRDPEATLTAAMQAARRNQVTLVEASMGRRSLETLFFRLTGAQMRDEGVDESAP